MALATTQLLSLAAKAALHPAASSAVLAPLSRLALGPYVRGFSTRLPAKKAEHDSPAELKPREEASTTLHPLFGLPTHPATFGRLNHVFQDMQREMDALFRSFPFSDSVFRDPFSFDGYGAPASPAAPSRLRLYADVTEDPQNFYVTADVPGMTKDDVKVQLSKDNVLTITAERKNVVEDTKDNVHRVERNYGKFVRSFQLPDNVDTNAISAETKEGVLKLKIPKLPEAQPQVKEIPVS